ncbi:MAG: alcohol dehydrogenase catalytic domain-containing protein, partial [Pseudomonadota bacterium]
MSTFQALWITEAEDKKYERSIIERQVSDLPEGDVLIKVAYSSLNYKDGLSCSGNKGVTRKFPHTPGIDAAGVVAESSHANFKEGDEVLVTGYDLGMNTPGGYGGYIRVPAGWVLKLPSGLSQQDSMLYGTAGFTAALCIDKLQRAGVTPEDGEILVTGASGGVGSVGVGIL